MSVKGWSTIAKIATDFNGGYFSCFLDAAESVASDYYCLKCSVTCISVLSQRQATVSAGFCVRYKTQVIAFK